MFITPVLISTSVYGMPLMCARIFMHVRMYVHVCATHIRIYVCATYALGMRGCTTRLMCVTCSILHRLMSVSCKKDAACLVQHA